GAPSPRDPRRGCPGSTARRRGTASSLGRGNLFNRRAGVGGHWRGQAPSDGLGLPTSAATGKNPKASLSAARAACRASASAAVTAVTVALRVAHHFLDDRRSVTWLTLLSRVRPLKSDDNRSGARRGH